MEIAPQMKIIVLFSSRKWSLIHLLAIEIIRSSSKAVEAQKLRENIIKNAAMNTISQNKFNNELSKAMEALKLIIQYGQTFKESASLLEIVDEDSMGKTKLSPRIKLIEHLKIKNQVNILYSEIKDKKISQYLQKFLAAIQVLFLKGRKY